MSAEWAEEPAPAPAVGTHPGALLAAQRQALGWTVEQVAEQLKLARRQIIALEAGDYAALPGNAIVRGFIRAYAKVVKLDAAPLVAMIAPDQPEPAESQPVRREKPATFSEVRFPTSGDRPFPYGWLIGAVVVAGIGFGAYQFGLVPTHLSTPVATVAEPAAPAAETAAVPPVETTLLKADQELSAVKPAPALVDVPSAQPAATATPPATATTPAATAATAPATAPATPAPAAAKPAATAAAPAPVPAAPAATAPAAAAAPAPAPAKPGANALVFTVKGESWIEVRSAATNKVLLSRLAKPGANEFIEVTEPVNLIVGKPEEVSATLRGAPLELKPVAGGTTARLSLK
jgi:cytoskeleton protein RodZ